ncbi:MAG TPA: LysE family translocator [Alphaproteobacteria bacterium]|jgi:threonine/homoserine/homoserine lactone efflux protein
MSLASYLALAAAVFILALTPGPVVVATVARSLFSGLRPAFGFVGGVAAVDLAYLLLAVFGLSAISSVLGELFIAIKIVGAAYLIYLGIRLWTDRAHAGDVAAAPVPRRFWKSFAEGALVDLGNPKIILFYAAFLPTFADLDQLGARDVALMAAVVVGILIVTNLGFAWLASRARVFIRSPRAVKAINRTSGTLMIGAGAWVATR